MARHRVESNLRCDVEPFPFWKAFRHDLNGFGLLAAGSLCIGLTVNALRTPSLALRYEPPRTRLGEIVARMPDAGFSNAASVDRQPIGLDEFQALVLAHRGLAIDARSNAFYQAGHVPGALNLPRDDFEHNFPSVRAPLEANRARPIVVYCAEADCKDSELVAEALNRLGFRNVRVYKEGWEEWLRAGLPQEATNLPP